MGKAATATNRRTRLLLSDEKEEKRREKRAAIMGATDWVCLVGEEIWILVM